MVFSVRLVSWLRFALIFFSSAVELAAVFVNDPMAASKYSFTTGPMVPADSLPDATLAQHRSRYFKGINRSRT